MARKKTSVSAVNTKSYFIIDNERLFKARTAGIQDVNKETEDLLNGTVYTNALKQALEKAPVDNGTFIIGLFGEWGIGKSTIIKNVKEDLEKKTEKKYKFIVYDAWKFVNDSFRRMFLLRLVDELGLEKEPFMDRFYSNLSEDKEINITYNSKKMRNYIVLPWAVWLVAVISLWLWGGRDNFVLQIINTIVSAFIPFFFSSLIRVFDELKTTKQTPLVFAAEQFTDCFSNILEETLRKNESENCRIVSWIKRGVRKIQGKTEILDKLVIVIDNIDRCSPDVAYELLTTVKTFFVNHNNLILIIPVDERALCEHMRDRFDRDSNRAAEFLRKIFNLEIRIKPLENVELYDFASRTNNDYELGFSSAAVEIIAKEYASNPRRIIQFFNNARTEWDIISQRLGGFSDQDIELAKNTMCKLLIIREEWPDYYEQIRRDPGKLLEGHCAEQQDAECTTKLNAFLKSTEFYPILEDESKLSKLISNNRFFDELPVKTITDLQSLDISKVTEFIKKSDKNQSKVVKYIDANITRALERKIIGTAASWFKFALQVNSAIGGFSSSNNTQLKRSLKEHVGEIVSVMMQKGSVDAFVDDLIIYINMLNKSNQTYMFTEIMESCIVPNVKTQELFDDDVTNVDLLYCELIKGITRKELFGKYKEYFCTWKLQMPESVCDISKIAASDLKYFITDEFQARLVDKISLTNENETPYLNEAIYLLANYKQDGPSVENVFSKLDAVYPNYAPGQKSRSIKLLNNILPVLEIVRPKNFVSEISKLIKKLLMFQPYGQNIVAHETYADKDEYIEVMELLCKLLNYTLDNNIPKDAGVSSVNDLVVQYLSDIINRVPSLQIDLLSCIENDIVNPDACKQRLISLVFGKGVYNDDYVSTVESMVLWHLTTEPKDSENYWSVSDNQLAPEILRFSSEFKTADADKKVLLRELLEFLYEKREKAVKMAMQEITDSEIIAELPLNAKGLALQKIYENLGAYENDIPMLKVVAQNADADTIKTLVENIILKKMVDSSEKGRALEIFDCIPKGKSVKYKSKINALK